MYACSVHIVHIQCEHTRNFWLISNAISSIFFSFLTHDLWKIKWKQKFAEKKPQIFSICNRKKKLRMKWLRMFATRTQQKRYTFLTETCACQWLSFTFLCLLTNKPSIICLHTQLTPGNFEANRPCNFLWSLPMLFISISLWFQSFSIGSAIIFKYFSSFFLSLLIRFWRRSWKAVPTEHLNADFFYFFIMLFHFSVARSLSSSIFQISLFRWFLCPFQWLLSRASKQSTEQCTKRFKSLKIYIYI